MDSQVLSAMTTTFLMLSLGVVSSYNNSATLEAYWNTMLGNTVMPATIKDSLVHDASNEVKGILLATSINIYKCSSPPKKSELNDDTITSLFFLEKDLRVGKKMSLHFPKNDIGQSPFLPRHVAKTLPFSTNKLTQILDHFSIKQRSQEAAFIKETLERCEKEKSLTNENYCATSLESMIDHVTSILGKHVNAVSTMVPKDTFMQEYVILEAKKLGDGHSAISCHRSSYPYMVFICHKRPVTVPYMVSLLGSDGMKVDAAAVCHEDTSYWSPEFAAFQVLNVKPGATVCHFLYQYNILWVRN
ncbi:hypothetical protein Droror1_Dr00015118 [Drosera rotundifolia]